MVNDNIIGRQRPDGYGSWNSAMDQAAGVAPAEFAAYTCNEEIVERFARSLGGENIRPSMLIAPSRLGSGVLRAQIPGNLAFTVTNGTSPNVNGSTRVGSDGLIETAKTNLTLQSEDFTAGFHTKFNLNAFGSGSVANTTATRDPYGTNFADYIQEDSAAGVVHGIIDIFAGIVSGTTYTWSVFAKAGERTIINLFDNSGSGANAKFNLTTGVATLNSGVSASMQNYGNGWWRCRLTYTAIITGNFNVQVRLCDASGNSSYNGTGNQGAYIFGAQLEVGSTASGYIPTTTVARTRFAGVDVNSNVNTNAPRLDYFGQSCPGLLVEPSATNFARWVNQMTAQDTPTASGGMTITTGSTDFLAPDGTSGSINKYVGGAASGNSQYAYYTGAGIVVAASGQHTFSLFVKAGATNPLNFCTLNFTAYSGGSGTATSYFSLASGTALTAGASIQDYGNGWYRLISAPYTIASGDLNGTLVFGMAEANNDISWPASGALNLTAYTWGAQLETGSVATSYIPTTTGTVTRNADVISASGVSGLIGQTEGTIYAEVDLRDGVRDTVGGNGILDIATSSTSRTNAVSILKGTTANSLLMGVRTAGANTILTSTSYVVGLNKIALAYQSGNTVLYVNGVQALSSATAFTFSGELGAVNLGYYGSFILNDRIRAAALYTTRLSNEQLTLLTSPTYYGDIADMSWAYYLNRSGESVPSCLQTRNYQLLQV